MRSNRILDVPWWVGLLFGVVILAVAVGGAWLEHRAGGPRSRSHLVFAAIGAAFGALLVVDALV